MAVILGLLLLLSCSIAEQASPSSSLATGWQDEHFGGKPNGKGWLYNDSNESSPLARSAGLRGTAELPEMLVKRTSGSPSNRRLPSHLQNTGLQQVTPSHIQSGTPPAPDARADSTATSSHVPADAPVASHTESGSSSKQPNKINRRPPGSLKDNMGLKAHVQRIKDGEQIDKTKPGGAKNALSMREKSLARNRANSQRFWRSRTKDERKVLNRQRTERYRRAKEKKKAEQEGRSWQEPPRRKAGRPRRNLAGTEADTRVEEVTQHAVDVFRGPLGTQEPATSRLRTPESSSSSSTAPDTSFPKATYTFFPPRPASPQQDLRSLPSTPESSTSTQRQIGASQQAALPSASTMEAERLRLALAPPQADLPDEHDRLRLTLGPPKHD